MDEEILFSQKKAKEGDSIHPYRLQCAGHGYDDPGSGLLVLREQSGFKFILKPYQDVHVTMDEDETDLTLDSKLRCRGLRESRFLWSLWESYAKTHPMFALREFIPKYFGNYETARGKFLKIEHLTNKFVRPCVVDIKVGRQTYLPHDTPAKKKKKIARYPWQADVGFRFSGMKVYDNKRRCYRQYGKEFCYLIDPTRFDEAWNLYFDTGQPPDKLVVVSILHKLGKLLGHLERLNYWSFYSSSLLLIYEGATGRAGTPCTEEFCFSNISSSNSNYSNCSSRSSPDPHAPATLKPTASDPAHRPCKPQSPPCQPPKPPPPFRNSAPLLVHHPDGGPESRRQIHQPEGPESRLKNHLPGPESHLPGRPESSRQGRPMSAKAPNARDAQPHFPAPPPPRTHPAADAPAKSKTTKTSLKKRTGAPTTTTAHAVGAEEKAGEFAPPVPPPPVPEVRGEGPVQEVEGTARTNPAPATAAAYEHPALRAAGASTPPQAQNQRTLDTLRCGVYMIDFGNTFQSNEVDDNYVFGLKSLIESLTAKMDY